MPRQAIKDKWDKRFTFVFQNPSESMDDVISRRKEDEKEFKPSDFGLTKKVSDDGVFYRAELMQISCFKNRDYCVTTFVSLSDFPGLFTFFTFPQHYIPRWKDIIDSANGELKRCQAQPGFMDRLKSVLVRSPASACDWAS